ncbi:MAG: chromosome segregation protein SMC [Myxococcota bacterium]
MHIKKLEICGFKSFVDRTVIHFDHDMIGVVGPNGCGKSNVVDAIRWVMGEQSAKALRGKAMGDVIFNGSETRPQAGFAEVTITFDNADPGMAASLPLHYRDFAEISVTRRLYRGDGSNAYFINKVPARLRDVTDVFLGTGVGRKAYSIVEQGKIGLIVSARPEDRRILIEEAAGITKYKARRRQAENKMNMTRQNLTRVQDIVSEIERQLESLKRQAAKAQRFIRYRDELEDLVLWDASHRWLELTAVIDVAARQRDELEVRVVAERDAVARRDDELESLRQSTSEAEVTAEQAQHDAFGSDNEVREHQARLERASDRFDHLSERLASDLEEQCTLGEKAETVALEREALSDERQRADAERARERTRAAEAESVLDELRTESERAEARVASARRDEAAGAAAIARAEAEMEGHAARAREMGARSARLERELARLTGERAGLARRRGELCDHTTRMETRRRALDDARDALAEELPEWRRATERKQRELTEARDEMQRRQSRLSALEELERRMDGLGDGVRRLLATEDAALSGILADRIEVPAEMTAALSGLIGDRLQCVIVEDVDRALDLLRGLAEGREGRATIISRRPAVPRTANSWHDDPGVVGPVIDQLRYAEEDAGVVAALVGDAVLVRSDADARRLSGFGGPSQGLLSSEGLTAPRRGLLPPGCELVTPDGTVFHADGRITGGAGDAFAAGMLEQKREIRDLRTDLADRRARVEEIEAAASTHRERLTRLETALSDAGVRAHQAELDLVTAQQDLQRLEQRTTLVERRYDEVARDTLETHDARGDADGASAATRRTLLGARSRHTLAGAAREAFERRSEALRQQLVRRQRAFTERKVALAAMDERVGGAERTLSRLAREYEDLRRRTVELEAARTEGAEEAGRLAAEMLHTRSAWLDARRQAREAQAAFERARLGLDDARHSLGIREAELRELRQALETLADALREQQMTHQRLELEREHLFEATAERFRGLELPRVVGDYHARALATDVERKRIRELTQLIDRMGSVNLEAVTEHEEAQTRFDYFTEQRDDLLKALSDLEAAIEQMDLESTRLFQHAFEGISRRFREIFPKMFRGGKAELRLNRPDDLLETGIEILAQPPGKRLGNLELMSGGEKAFTAVSLLLAIFRFKPSPFCILDEVDAPLDDANVGRYVEALRAMTDRSQFIIITHSKRTMESVDVLYGVTMQDAGVSKLVGVRVNEGASRSDQKRAAREAEARQRVVDEAAETTRMAAGGATAEDESRAAG